MDGTGFMLTFGTGAGEIVDFVEAGATIHAGIGGTLVYNNTQSLSMQFSV
jgi:hypothetical protein